MSNDLLKIHENARIILRIAIALSCIQFAISILTLLLVTAFLVNISGHVREAKADAAEAKQYWEIDHVRLRSRVDILEEKLKELEEDGL